MMCVKAHELLAGKTEYPLHVGITEAGTVLSGNIKSAIGLGLILNQGIGDTIRVSLTGDVVEEIKSAKLILRTLGLRKGGIEVVSCPTCGRTKIDQIKLANEVETVSYTHLEQPEMEGYFMDDLEYKIYLKSLSKQFPTIADAATEIINLQAILSLPKGTEHFLTDIHGEYEQFNHCLLYTSILHFAEDSGRSSTLSSSGRIMCGP